MIGSRNSSQTQSFGPTSASDRPPSRGLRVSKPPQLGEFLSMATRDGRRLARRSSISSKVSLFSAFTSSSGSSGSTNTVTPDSLRRPKKKNTMPSRQTAKNQPSVRRQYRISADEDGQSASQIDVFQFLDHTRSTNSSRLSLAGGPHTIPRPSVAPPILPEDNEVITHPVKTDSSARSIHSDSGISIRDSSPDPPSRRGSELEIVAEECPQRNAVVSAHRIPSRVNLPGTLLESSESEEESPNEDAGSSFEANDDEPESFYRPAFGPQSTIAANTNAPPKQVNTHQADFGGYDLLARHLSSTKSPALYRRFEWLRHRSLLYLQDEIGQLEEEMKRLDRWDSDSRAAIARSTRSNEVPSSRRMDWKYRGSLELCGRRTDVMAKIQSKLRDYGMHMNAAALAGFR